MSGDGDETRDTEGFERPADTLIRVSYYTDQTLVTIPPRPLIWPLRILMTLHIGSIVFLVAAGVIYFIFHRSIFTGLPDPPAVFSRTGSHAAEYKWYAEVTIGWLASFGFLVTILGLVWIPQIATESLSVNARGLEWQRHGWWRHERVDALWGSVVEVVLLGRHPEFAPNSLIIQLEGGIQQSIAESTSNSEREWLGLVLQKVIGRFRQSQ